VPLALARMRARCVRDLGINGARTFLVVKVVLRLGKGSGEGKPELGLIFSHVSFKWQRNL
jgi:hypothetical protein